LNANDTGVEDATSALTDLPLMVSVGSATIKLSCWVAVVLAASVTRTVNWEFPTEVGVPVIVPELPSNVRPDGREPAANDHEYGGVPPETAIVKE
jgi:hypothetical protein